MHLVVSRLNQSNKVMFQPNSKPQDHRRLSLARGRSFWPEIALNEAEIGKTARASIPLEGAFGTQRFPT